MAKINRGSSIKAKRVDKLFYILQKGVKNNFGEIEDIMFRPLSKINAFRDMRTVGNF
jgi:hypothetical protein